MSTISINTEIEIYKKIQPLQHIVEEAVEFVKSHSICNANAIQVRKTDFQIFRANKDERFIKIIENSNRSFFLATDNIETSINYVKNFGSNKIITYSHFSPKLSSSLRQTYLKTSVTEAVIASYSLEFYMTHDSSWSEYIDLLHQSCIIDYCCKQLIN